MNRHSDSGSITLETVIAVPVALLLTMLIINAALWYQAHATALAAAQEGVRVGRAHGTNPDQAGSTAVSFARTTGHGFLNSPTADTSDSTTTTIVVRVRGKAVSLVPGLRLSVDQIARGPIERFTADTRGSTNSDDQRGGG